MPKRSRNEWRANCVERRREKLAARKREEKKGREGQVQQTDALSDDQVQAEAVSNGQVNQESQPFPDPVAQAEAPQPLENAVSGVPDVEDAVEQTVVSEGQVDQESQSFPDPIAQADVPQPMEDAVSGVQNVEDTVEHTAVSDGPVEPTVVSDGQIIQESQPFSDPIAQAEVPQSVENAVSGVSNVEQAVEPTESTKESSAKGRRRTIRNVEEVKAEQAEFGVPLEMPEPSSFTLKRSKAPGSRVMTFECPVPTCETRLGVTYTRQSDHHLYHLGHLPIEFDDSKGQCPQCGRFLEDKNAPHTCIQCPKCNKLKATYELLRLHINRCPKKIQYFGDKYVAGEFVAGNTGSRTSSTICKVCEHPFQPWKDERKHKLECGIRSAHLQRLRRESGLGTDPNRVRAVLYCDRKSSTPKPMAGIRARSAENLRRCYRKYLADVGAIESELKEFHICYQFSAKKQIDLGIESIDLGKTVQFANPSTDYGKLLLQWLQYCEDEDCAPEMYLGRKEAFSSLLQNWDMIIIVLGGIMEQRGESLYDVRVTFVPNKVNSNEFTRLIQDGEDSFYVIETTLGHIKEARDAENDTPGVMKYLLDHFTKGVEKRVVASENQQFFHKSGVPRYSRNGGEESDDSDVSEEEGQVEENLPA